MTGISLLGWLRASLRIALMVALLLICVPAHLGCRLLRMPSPWPRRLLGGCGRIVGVRLGCSGELGAAPVLILANHVSWLDIMLLAGATGSAFVAHAGLAANPALRWLCAQNATVFITRDRRSTVAGQARQLRDALAHRGTVTLFPEGTTGDGRVIAPFKSALLSAVEPSPAGLAVQPAWIDYGVAGTEIAWLGSERGIANFVRVLARRGPINATLHLLTPLAGDACANRKTMAEAARRRIVEAAERCRG